MTLGDKIKYCRRQMNLTQEQLGQLTGIHPVTIRKYEANKVQPLPPQLEKIATALGISVTALQGIGDIDFPMDTIGDLLGLLMVLFNSKIILIHGERGSDNMLKEATVSIKVNPKLEPYISFKLPDPKGYNLVSLKDGEINVSNQRLFRDLLIWEKMCYLYEAAKQSAGSNPDSLSQDVLRGIAETKDKVEFELIRSQILLGADEGIRVRVPPDIKF